jgi:hypothetical protein
MVELIATLESKGNSPFYPHHPVPVELFRGRGEQVTTLSTWGLAQTRDGKPTSFFLEGEYGIGKSSIAAYAARLAEQQGLLTIHVELGGVRTVEDVAARILQRAFDVHRAQQTTVTRLRNFAAEFFGQQSLFGINVDFEVFRQKAPSVSDAGSLAGFLSELTRRVADPDGLPKPIFLLLDEINGIASDAAFAHLLKGFVDSCTTRRPHLPVMLVLCGTAERRAAMIANHTPVNRLFEVIKIEPLDDQVVRAFFIEAFGSVGHTVDPDALDLMVEFSAGLPRVMHLIGDRTFRIDTDRRVTRVDTMDGVLAAAEEIGSSYVDPQVLNVTRSPSYREVLAWLGRRGPFQGPFAKTDLRHGLPNIPVTKVTNFLTRMKDLGVLRSPADAPKGTYEFTQRMVMVYLWLKTLEEHSAR